MAGITTLKLGWSNPLTDAFGAHPILGSVLDLNDGVNYTLLTPEGLELPPPPKTLVAAGNIRTQGERVTRALYRHNREVTLRLVFGPGSSYSSFIASVRTLLRWLDGPPQVPFAVQYQAPNAAAPVYLDVVGCAHSLPTDEGSWLRLQFEPVEITLLARPGLRGDRLTLQNLIPNPGFEAPSGPGIPVFAEQWANVGAYTVVSGSAPTLSPANTYVDIVQADSPARYLRLGEASGSGTTAYDISGNAQNGTTHGSPVQGHTGLLSGDTATCYSFSSPSNQYVSVPSTGLPSGNNPVTLEAWVQIAAAPSANQCIIGYGTAGTQHDALDLFINSSGKAVLDIGGGGTNVTSTSALSFNTPHHLVGTWDGTTMTLYVDGVSQGTATPGNEAIPASPSLTIGVFSTLAQYFSGQIQEVCVYAAALSSSRVSAHYTAGHSGASGTVANSMSLSSGSQVKFGSPNWASINQWTLRFRWVSGLTIIWYLHYSSGSNNLSADLTPTAFQLYQKIAGVNNQLANAAVTPVHEAWYWLTLTQFPGYGWVTGDPVWIQAVLQSDQNGAPGATLATLSGATTDALTALVGQPQISASGAALAFGGAATPSNGHTVSMFGPGGWQLVNVGAGISSGAWEQNQQGGPANTFPSGPVNSYGAARIDLSPSASLAVDAYWHLTSGGSATTIAQQGIPASVGQVLGLSVWAKSSGLSATATTRMQVAEYDANGNLLLTSAALFAQSGNLASWTQLSGTYTVQSASCAYVDVLLRVSDATAGASANGTLWFDNAQAWNETTTGATTMPYCELRFPQAPALLVVSGLLGDLPAPALVSLGLWLASFPTSSLLNLALGRGAQASASARLVGTSTGLNTPGSGITYLLDPASYGGYYVQAAPGLGGWNPRAFSPLAADEPGTYHLLARLLTQESSGNLSGVTVRTQTQQRTQP